MKLPLFYKPEIVHAEPSVVVVDEATSKHIIQVLRMQAGEQLQLTDGKGGLFTVEITDDNRKKCGVKILSSAYAPPGSKKISVAISPLKNNSRFEWFLEKATEIGVNKIVPLVCERTEKQQLKFERMQSIMVSAMLQSQQVWMPVFTDPVKFDSYVRQISKEPSLQKLIAHCGEEENKIQLAKELNDDPVNRLILIGPEGDFTEAEIQVARENGFTPVALGDTRLRTETAGIVAVTLLCNI